METITCPICNGEGSLTAPIVLPKNMKQERIKIAHALRYAKYSIREIMHIMNYKSTLSVTLLLQEPPPSEPSTIPVVDTVADVWNLHDLMSVAWNKPDSLQACVKIAVEYADRQNKKSNAVVDYEIMLLEFFLSCIDYYVATTPFGTYEIEGKEWEGQKIYWMKGPGRTPCTFATLKEAKEHTQTEYAENIKKTIRARQMSSPYDQNFLKSIELLRDLADIQNGAPLIQSEKEWTRIMEDVYSFLKEHEVGTKQHPGA